MQICVKNHNKWILVYYKIKICANNVNTIYKTLTTSVYFV